MRLSLNNKDIINLLSNTGKLSANEFYKKLDKTIKNNIGHRLFTLTVVDYSIKYVERVYSNNIKIYPLLGTKPIPINSWTNKVINNKKIQDKAHSILQGKRYYIIIKQKV